MMQSMAADVFHSVKTAESHVCFEPLASLLHISGTSAGAQRGPAAGPAAQGGNRAGPRGAGPLLQSLRATLGAEPHLSAADLRLQRAASLWSPRLLSWVWRPARALGQGRRQAQALEQGLGQRPAQARGRSRARARPGRCGRAAGPGPGSAPAHLGGMARAAAPGQAQKRADVLS